MVAIMGGRVGKHSVERVRYVIYNLLHLVIVKYGVISSLKFSHAASSREKIRGSLVVTKQLLLGKS